MKILRINELENIDDIMSGDDMSKQLYLIVSDNEKYYLSELMNVRFFNKEGLKYYRPKNLDNLILDELLQHSYDDIESAKIEISNFNGGDVEHRGEVINMKPPIFIGNRIVDNLGDIKWKIITYFYGAYRE